ncbi:MAG: tetratricopeptide repeat protein [Candidatus Cloacimonetes bacterium]|nr:tetratricopeptide repeat protein [Candidatus Cloacimonadota bacterium]
MLRSLFFLCCLIILLTSCAGQHLNHHDPEPQPEPVNFKSLNYYALAEAAVQAGDYQSAVSLLKKADSEVPDNVSIKERLIDVMAVISYVNPEMHQELITTAEDYYQRGLYTEKILRNLAESYRKSGNNQKAEVFLVKALELNPTQHLYLAYYYFQLSVGAEPDTTLLTKALAYPWESSEDVIQIARVFARENPEKAITILEEAYHRWDDLKVLTPLFQLYSDQNRHAEIKTILENRVEKKQDLGQNFTSYLVASYFTNKQFGKIIRLQDQCLETSDHRTIQFLFFSALNESDYPLAVKAGNTLAELGELPPDLEHSLNGYLGLANFYTENYQNAIANFVSCREVQLLADIFHEISVNQQNLEQTQFIDFLKSYATAEPDLDRANFLTGYSLVIVDQGEIAESYLNAVSLQFLIDNDLLGKAVVAYLRGTGNTGKAIDLLNARTEQEPTVNSFLGLYYYNENSDSLAFNYFRREISENPEPSLQVFIITSILCEKLDLVKDTLPELEKSLILYPDNPEVMNMIAYLIVNNDIYEKFNSAELLLTRAIKIAPENPMIKDSIAWLYYKQGKYQEALQEMTAILETPVEHSEIAYHLGEIYLKLEQPGKAKIYFELALSLDNEEKSVSRAREALYKIEN